MARQRRLGFRAAGGRFRLRAFCRRHTGSRIDWRARPGVSAAYALAEATGWQEGLERKAGDARGFYGVIAVSILAALAIQYLPISPMKALFWSAVINGVVAVPLMIVVILLASSRSVARTTRSGQRGERPYFAGPSGYRPVPRVSGFPFHPVMS
ncbi:divalent metal cation transporter [Mesorhizobium sp. ESP-6-4]|nr:divalent metal cation transporter [Mesorhizobium sp. ESP-6-4]